jgi:hypothetical protein
MKAKHGRRRSLKKRAQRGFRGYPIATVAYYGPNDKHATKVAVGIVKDESGEVAELRRWFSDHGDIRTDQEINREILQFIDSQGPRSVVIADRIMGCPHEEGIDYPEGESCPKCPFWAYRDRYTGEVLH